MSRSTNQPHDDGPSRQFDPGPGSGGDGARRRAIAERLYAGVVADLLDELGFREQALDSHIAPLTEGSQIFGRAMTVQAADALAMPDEPYKKELEAVDSLHEGDVLVAAIQASQDCGFWGELLTAAALTKKAAGAVIDGYTRDSAAVAASDFPLFARGTNPLDSKGRTEVVDIGVPVRCGGVRVEPGDFVFGDRDGVLVIPARHVDAVLERALEKTSAESEMRTALRDGMSVVAAYERYGVL
jgi:4-hydroxy-4-methyl-2-oxoglutarate aldolase